MAARRKAPVRELTTPIQPDAGTVHRGFFHASPVPFLLLTFDGYVTEANAAAHTMLGHHGVLSGAPLVPMMVETDRPAVAAVIADAAAGIDAETDATVRAAGRSPAVPIAMTAASFAANGETLLAVTLVDRGAEVDAVRDLRSSEQQYRTLFMRAPIPLREEDFSAVGEWMGELRSRGITDFEAHLDENPDEVMRAIGLIQTRRVNPALLDLLGTDDEAAVIDTGFTAAELTPEVVAVFRDEFLAIWAGASSFEAEFTGADRSGMPYRCQLHWTVQRVNGVPDLSRVIASIFDVTAIRAAEDDLRALIAEKDRFIATISHELRTPLAAVVGLSHELDDRWDDFDDEEIRSFIELISNQSGFLSALVEDLLLVARLDMGDIPVMAERVDLLRIIDGAIDDVARSDIELREVLIRGGRQYAVGDGARIRQILRNLLANAAKYGGPNVRVEVVEGAWATVLVVDDGDGIPIEHRESAFHPYERANAPHLIGSLGLGLAISRQLAHAMGGDLNYTYADGESVFALTLPPAV